MMLEKNANRGRLSFILYAAAYTGKRHRPNSGLNQCKCGVTPLTQNRVPSYIYTGATEIRIYLEDEVLR